MYQQAPLKLNSSSVPERIYNPITSMGFSAMFTLQLDNTKRKTLPAPHGHNGSCKYVRVVAVVADFGHQLYQIKKEKTVPYLLIIPSSINNYDPMVPILQHCAYFGKRQLGKRQANIDDGCSTRRR